MKNTPIGWGWAGKQYAANCYLHYKLTKVEWEKLWTLQDGKCEGCEEEFAHPYRKELRMGVKPEVDHDHATGKVRGLLCRRCNDFLGKIKDNQKTLRRLEAYLRRHGEQI